MFIVNEENISASDFQSCYILSNEERVDEIINEVYGWEYNEGCHISGLEVAVCISKVVGMSDNIIHKEQLIKSQTNWSTLRPFRVNSIISYLPYLKQYIIAPKTQKHYGPDYLIDETDGYMWILDECTIKNAIEMVSSCINSVENPIETSLKYELCDNDQYNRLDDLITIREFKDMLYKMINIKGELHYRSDLDKKPANAIEKNKDDLTYYDNYINRIAFIPQMTEINEKQIRSMVNKNNALLVSLRDYINSLGLTVNWNNGQIFIEGKKTSLVLCLDNFSNNSEIRRMFIDKSIYAQHSVINENEEGIYYDLEKSYTYFGQYVIIQDTVYLYPKTYERIDEYINQTSIHSDKETRTTGKGDG